MTDLDMIVLAVRAMGFKHAMCWEADPEHGHPHAYAKLNKGVYWKPLDNGDHALQIVTKLKLHIGMEVGVANAWASDDYGNFQTVILEHFGDEAALKRAIVKAAAHYGGKLA
jgi:hypothetical protein